MRRKLWLLNLVLVAVLFWGWNKANTSWKEQAARRQGELGRQVKPVPAPPFSPLAQVAAVLPSVYQKIAQSMLFDRSRNPDVVVEVVPPPPPKPMPTLPIFRGMMNIGGGPLAIFSQAGATGSETLRAGDKIGEFKLVSFNSSEVVLEWDGKTIRRSPGDLMPKESAPTVAGASVVNAGMAAILNAVPTPQVAAKAAGPGQDAGVGKKLCEPGDSTPAGTVSDGYRKVVTQTPFGQSCYWESVGH